MARFTDINAVITHVKAHTDILQIILEDTGRQDPNPGSSDNHFIFCPFHNEKNKASFNINIRMQAWRCFGGCADGGDVIKWCQLFHGMSMPEAVGYLAQRCNIDISQYIRPATQEEMVKDRYHQVFNMAVEWCHTQLMNHPTLLQWYRDDTGFTEEQIEEYKIGYCPSVEMMVSALFKSVSNLTRAEISKLELDNPVQFNDALVYPIHDTGGVACRIYTKPLHPPPTASYKYLGTSNHHPLFRKDLVYGLYQQRKNLRTNGYRVILNEGFKAAIAAAGIAVMGTAVADEQIVTLRQIGVKQIVICFDGDQPGFIASIKVIEELHRFRGLILKVARLPLDTQCDGLIKASGIEALQAVIQNAKLPIEFFIDNQYNVKALTLEAKYQILAEIGPILTKMNEAEADISGAYLAERLGVTPEGIQSYIRDLKATTGKLANGRAEDTVLQHVMMNATSLVELKTALYTEEFFTSSDNQRIYTAINKAYSDHHTGITARVVQDRLGSLFPNDAERLTKRVDFLMTTDVEYSFETAAKIVLDLWRRRATIKQADELKAHMQDVNQTPLDALHKFRRVAISTIDVNDNQAVNPTDVADKVMRIVDERAGQTNAVIGYSFGTAMPVLNSLMSGIQKGHQYVIAANQSVGKSVFALNLINPIAIDQQVPGLWIAQEMVEEDLVMRLMSIRTGINNNRIQSGKMTPEEYLMYRCALQDYARGNLYIRKPLSGTIDEILALIEEYKFKHGIEFIVWDYMQLVVASRDQRGMSTTEVLGYASNVMTNRVAGSMNLASICIAQLNRSEYKKGEVREGESIGGAYKIVQDASDVITLAEKTDKQIEEFGKDRGNRFISVDKRRGGASDVLLHGNLDKHDKISLKFTECVKEPEAIGFTKSLAV